MHSTSARAEVEAMLPGYRVEELGGASRVAAYPLPVRG
jgi:hypothetical protein